MRLDQSAHRVRPVSPDSLDLTDLQVRRESRVTLETRATLDRLEHVVLRASPGLMVTLARLDHKETPVSGAKWASLVLLDRWAELALLE